MLRAEQAIEDDGQRDREENELKRGARVAPPEKAPDERATEETSVSTVIPRFHAQVHCMELPAVARR